MDFNPMDEQSPLTDFWQMNDGLDSEDAAVIATLATQALQSKFNYEYEDSIGVNGQAEVANYTESRSSPQSQYSAFAHEEPAESFRGLMEDHDRGAQFSGQDATSEYDLEPATRGRVLDNVAGIEEPAVFMRESDLADPLYSLLNVSADMDEMRGTMTASQIVNEVLRNSEIAAAQSQMDVNIQALHSQAAQLTPPDSESPSIVAEERDHRDLEEDFLTSVSGQHDDCEPENVIIEEASLDTKAQQQPQPMAEPNERPIMDEGRQPSPSRPAPRKVGRPRKSDTEVEPPDLAPKESGITEMAVREKVVIEGDDEVAEPAEPAVADEAEINTAEETPAARRRGRPRKSEIPELTRASSTKRGPGRPPKLVASEVTSEWTPTTGKRGRPRKSDVEDQSQVHTKESDIPIEEAPIATSAPGKRGRPRKSGVEDESQIHAKESDIPAEETPAAGKRGRPRKSGVEDESQVHTKEYDIPAEETPAVIPAAGKRGRPRKSEVENESQKHAKESDIPVEETPAATSAAAKRGRPRRNTLVDVLQAPTNESQLPTVEASVSTPSLSKRGRPRKSEVVNAAHHPTDEHTLAATEAASSTPAPSRRGRPRKSEVMSTTQNLTDEHALSVAEIATSTPAPSKRGRPRRSDAAQESTNEPQPLIVETPIVTPASGKRGRPPRNAAVLATAAETRAAPEMQAESEITATADVIPPAAEAMEQRSPPPQQDGASEGLHTSSPPTAPVQKRGRGRPPKNDISVNTTTGLETATNDEEAEPQGLRSEHVIDVLEDIAVDENSGAEVVQEDIEVTPARKRGRPKSSAADKPSHMIPTPIKASAKKRGRPPKAATTADAAERLEEPSQPEAQEHEERIAKRRRTDSDIIMEDPPEDPRPETREERPAGVRERRVSFAAGTKAPKELVPIKFTRRNSDSAGSRPGFISINIQRKPKFGQADSSKETTGVEMPEKRTATQQTELFTSGLPKPTLEGVFDRKKLGKRPKTYGKRLKKGSLYNVQ
ncbi:hypothetical protein LI328DRAFT_143578 [Trichoderma asperelloides]|nr:hypothetical protein LI328DRAFT_143578 [Trichoderma asperelloides]